MNKIKDLIGYLESIAPPVYQESYDNAGLIVGDRQAPITGVICCLDATEGVIEEAIERQCNVVVAHHPIVFRGLKQITGRNYVERVIIKAIKNDIAIYAIHTNLDNVYWKGVNGKIADRLGLINTQILAPKQHLKKVSVNLAKKTFPVLEAELKKMGLSVLGHWPMEDQMRLETLFAPGQKGALFQLLNSVDCSFQSSDVDQINPGIGSGMLGELPNTMPSIDFLKHLKDCMQTSVVKHTKILQPTVKKIALCGGSGGFLLSAAIRQKADVFITADYKYHEFFDADQQIVIADIGHYESEQFTIDLLYELITQKFSNFAAYCTKVNTNPVHYFI